MNEKDVNEGNQIHNFISSSGSGTVINYGSGSDNKLRVQFQFRFHSPKSYGFYGSGSGSTTLLIHNPGERSNYFGKSVNVPGSE